VIDAIETLSPMVYLIFHSIHLGLPVVSSMGAGGKTDPQKIHITDISKSHNCQLARIIRKRLARMGIKKWG
jgi:tRNA A37 threonylcarbamoyladenosine dehydratase